MARATLLLEDGLFKQAKALSKKRGTTLKEVINDLLRLALNSLSTANKAKTTVTLPLFNSITPRDGFDPADRSTWDIVYDKKPS